jgi:hypothetical protein
MQLTNNYNFLDTNVLIFINKIISNYPGFSEERFRLWIESSEIESKNNPSAFVNHCFLKELKKGTFTTPQLSEIIYVPETITMFIRMRELGIKVTPESTGDIDIACTYILKHNVLTPEELANLNRDIINHLETNKDIKTTNAFVDLMKKSKALYGKVDWEAVDKEIKRASDECDQLLKSVAAVGPKHELAYNNTELIERAKAAGLAS